MPWKKPKERDGERWREKEREKERKREKEKEKERERERERKREKTITVLLFFVAADVCGAARGVVAAPSQRGREPALPPVQRPFACYVLQFQTLLGDAPIERDFSAGGRRSTMLTAGLPCRGRGGVPPTIELWFSLQSSKIVQISLNFGTLSLVCLQQS